MTIRYIDDHGKLISITDLVWFSVASDGIYNYIVYYTPGDERHELDLPVTVPYFIDNF
jgi:hypothetical protein